MKAEQRKELVTNSLAKNITKALKGLKEGPSRNTVLFLVILAIVLVLIFTWRYFAQAARDTDSTRWLEWDNLMLREQLAKYLENRDLQPTMQGRLGRLLSARIALANGVENIGQPGEKKREAILHLEAAASEYEKLVGELKDQPLLQQEALLNAGRAYEAQAKWTEARNCYQQLVDKYPDKPESPCWSSRVAKARLEQLDENIEANRTIMENLKKDVDSVRNSPAPPTGGPGAPPLPGQ
jgi:tetratricopeptide (TPR) repeat protein